MLLIRWILAHLMLIMLVAAVAYVYLNRGELGLVGIEPQRSSTIRQPAMPTEPRPTVEPAAPVASSSASAEPASGIADAESAPDRGVATTGPAASDSSSGGSEPGTVTPSAQDLSSSAPEPAAGDAPGRVESPPPMRAEPPAPMPRRPFAEPNDGDSPASPPSAGGASPRVSERARAGAGAARRIESWAPPIRPEPVAPIEPGPRPFAGPLFAEPPAGMFATPDRGDLPPPPGAEPGRGTTIDGPAEQTRDPAATSPIELLETARRAYWEGRLPQAVEAYQELLRADGASPALLVELGSALAASGDRSGAAERVAEATLALVAQGRSWEIPPLLNQVFALDYARGRALEQELRALQPPPTWR